MKEQNKKYDVIIKSGIKDYCKLKHVINSIKFLNPQPSKIYLINPDGYKPENTKYDDIIITVKDEDALPGCDREEIKYRKNWCFAQFIALFQDITEQDYYLDIQSDNFFLNPIDLFDKDGKPNFFMSPQHSHYCEAYFKFTEHMFDLEKVADDSFIVEFMMYNKKITKELLNKYGNDHKIFFKEACKITTKECCISDQDSYANWCLKHHPEKYNVIKDLYTEITGKYYPETYTEEEINDILISYEGTAKVAISLHTWNDGTPS
jgi:hypothetical protein